MSSINSIEPWTNFFFSLSEHFVHRIVNEVKKNEFSQLKGIEL